MAIFNGYVKLPEGSQPVDLNLDSCIPRPPVDTWLLAFYSKFIVKSWRFFPHLFHRHVPSFPIEITMLLHSYVFPIKITISWPINGFFPNNMAIKLPFIPYETGVSPSPSSQAAFSMVLHRPETLWDHGPGPGDPRRFWPGIPPILLDQSDFVYLFVSKTYTFSLQNWHFCQ